MGDEPFDLVECLHDTADWFRLKKRTIGEFFNPPDADKIENKRICLLCFESGATKRKCCNQLYCDHCYTKNQLCPYCGTSTRQEKLTGATFAVQSFSEHEECRCCLEPGTKRRCCGAYYCDECYYKLPQCRGCEAPTGNKPKLSAQWRGSVTSIVLSWLTTIFIIAGVIAGILTLMQNESQVKTLMSGYKCYGFWKDCTVDKCLDMDWSVAMGTEALPPLSSWKNCNLDSRSKLISKACIYDQQMYDSTDGHLGYDMCTDMFQEGLYIFEDTFEHWSPPTDVTDPWSDGASTDDLYVPVNPMVSAPWFNVVNGFSTPYCGVAEHLGENNALTFSGSDGREAETMDLDLSPGGWLEAELFIAPIGFDVSNPNCKSSYQGVIRVEYSTNGGNDWVIMDSFDAWKYRQEKFFPVKFPIPAGSDAATSHTRFRFRQDGSFQASRDHWALDNVRVLRFLPTNWYVYDLMVTNINKARSVIQLAQCCFDTDWCETRLTLDEMDSCGKYYEWYNGRNYFIRGAELYVMICFFINIIKWAYLCVVDYLLHQKYPFQDEWEDLTKIDRFMQYIPKRYRPKKDIASLVGNIHSSARLAAELGSVFQDDEGSGEVIKTEEDKLAERKEQQAKIKKEKKLLKERMKNRNFKGSQSLAVDEEKEQESDDEDAQLDSLFGAPPEEKPKDKGNDNMDDFKKTNVGMLRVPFETKVNWKWTMFFRNWTFIVFAIAAMTKMTTTSYYVVNQPYVAFGKYDGNMAVTSAGLFLIACFCDLKEIYFCVKKVVPCRQEWVPQITLDLQEDISSLFIGPHVVKLSDISEFTTFPDIFAILMAFAYIIGCFPWCLFSIILRDQFLDFEAMRVVTPTLGCVLAFRAIFGPGMIIKALFSLYYFFAVEPKTRERFGAALSNDKAKMAAFWTAISFSLGSYIIFGIIMYDYADIVAQLMILIGAIYGIFTGCMHSLPIHPWMYLTIIRGGVWMKVKKSQRCPCIYWGSSCNELHDMDEVFVIWSEDQIRFLNYLKGGVGAV